VVVAAIALAFTAWAELALTVELVAEPRLLLIVQFCWLLAVLGPAVQPETLRPQVLGNVLVPALLPLKIAGAALYLLCLPALLRLWPFAPAGDRRTRRRVDAARALCWFPYCGLFTTVFFTPPADDALGLLRFFGITAIVGVLLIGAGVVMQRRGAALARALYTRAIAPYALVVLVVAVITSFELR
jgi:FtsH-binding integral membrane protein